MINISKPSLTALEENAIAEVLRTGWIGHGQKVLEFEKACKEILQARHFIALSSCTKSIEVALIISGCKDGDEVLLPSLTYTSVVQVVVNLRLVPVFVDVDLTDFNISIEDTEKKITPKTRFIMPLHFRGHSCKIDEVQQLAATHNLVVIEDAAHAFGSYYKGRPVGSTSHMACFSFGPLKNISCIEGGGIATNSDEVAQKLISYRNLGMQKSTWQRFHGTVLQADKPWHYEVTAPGDKCQANDVCAATGLAQIHRMPQMKQKKKVLMQNYLEELSAIENIYIPETDVDYDFAYIFTILVGEHWREDFMTFLWNKGIGTTIHYHPAHIQPYFLKYNTGKLINTEAIGRKIVTIPFFTDLTESEQYYIISSIKEFIQGI